MRADRLLSLLILLQLRGRTSALKLAQELEVSERTIYRDLQALSTAGVPVYTERGPGGGCELLDNYRTTLTGLNEDELRALFMLNIPTPLADLGVSQALRSAMLKLTAALPGSSQATEAHTRQRIHLDPSTQARFDEPAPHLRTLYQAIWQDRQIEIAYRFWFGSEMRVIVSPYGLVARGSDWYLIYEQQGNQRAVRVADLEDVSLLAVTFERPADFDLAKFWITWSAQETESAYLVTLRAAPDLLPRLSRFFGVDFKRAVETAGPPDEDGWRTLTLTYNSLESARSRLLGFGGAVEVLTPEALRLSLADFAHQIVAKYQK
jgi:predicted DNA-binding transcriptional regulator YafY